MLTLKASDVYDVARPLHLYSQLLGVTSFSLRRVDGTFLAAYTWLNVLSLLLSNFWSLCFAVCFLFSVMDLWIVEEVSLTQIFEKSIVCIFFGFSICAVATNFWLFFARKHFATVFNLLIRIDEELERLTVPVNLKKHKLLCLLFIVFVQALAAFDVCLMEFIARASNLYKTNMFFDFTIWFSLQLTFLSVFHFMFMMWAVKLRYEKINSMMELLVKDSAPNGKEKLTSLAELHDSLVDVSEQINRCYGVPVSFFRRATSNESSELTFTSR